MNSLLKTHVFYLLKRYDEGNGDWQIVPEAWEFC